MKRVVTVTMLVLLVCVLGYAIVAAPGTVARRAVCHGTAVTLKSKVSVKARRPLTLTVSLPKNLGHGLDVTVQYRKSTSSAWRAAGAPRLMVETPTSLSWKAPKVKGRYKLRVKVGFVGENFSGTTYSNVKSVRVY